MGRRCSWWFVAPVALAAAAAACGPVARDRARTVPATSAFAPAASAASVAVNMPGPAPAREDAAVAANAACESCHREQAAEWRESLHHRADREPAYRRAFALEPQPFCRSCHAPEAKPEQPESDAVGALGVGCVTCHVTNGAVLAAPWTQSAPAPTAPHALARDARFATADACARCHEFPFPGNPRALPHERMQWTGTEHTRSRAAHVPCAGCHMADDGAGRRSHRFVASRDPAVVGSAVRVEARRDGDRRIVVVLVPKGAGHAFPTGDLFRRVEVLAQVEGPDHAVLASAVRYLGRHFELRDHGAGRRLLRDDRVFGEPVSVVLELPPVAARWPIVFRVAYQRVDHPNGPEEANAAVDGEIVLAAGRLPPFATAVDPPKLPNPPTLSPETP